MPSEQDEDKVERAGNLLGDTREQILKAVKRHVDFKNLAERNQRALVAEIEQVSRQAIRSVVEIAGAFRFPSASMSWSEWKVKGGMITPKAEIPVSPETVERFLAFHSGILVFADPDAFMGEREASEIFPDQGDLMQQGAEPEPPTDPGEENADRLRAGIRPLLDDSVPHVPETGEMLVGDGVDPAIAGARSRGWAAYQAGEPEDVPEDLAGDEALAVAFREAYDAARRLHEQHEGGEGPASPEGDPEGREPGEDAPPTAPDYDAQADQEEDGAGEPPPAQADEAPGDEAPKPRGRRSRGRRSPPPPEAAE